MNMSTFFEIKYMNELSFFFHCQVYDWGWFQNTGLYTNTKITPSSPPPPRDRTTCFSSVYMCFVVTCWERADLLALVCGVFCEFVTFPLVSWVRCGTWLYRFLIFAPLLTFIIRVVLSVLRGGPKKSPRTFI